MTVPPPARHQDPWSSWTVLAATLTVCSGALTLLAWRFDAGPLGALVSGRTAMNPVSAVCFILAGFALVLLRPSRTGATRQALGRGAAAVVIAIGALRLCALTGIVQVSVDEVLFRGQLGRDGFHLAGRMPAGGALDFVLLGLALLVMDVETRDGVRPAQYLALTAGGLALFPLVGHFYGIGPLYRVRFFAPMAGAAALTFSILASGVLTARPDRGLVRLIASPRIGGMIARRLLPAGLGGLFLLGWICYAGVRAGRYDTGFAIAMIVATAMALFAALTSMTASRLDRIDAERRQAEDARSLLASIVESSDDAIIGMTLEGTVVSWNSGAARLYGYSAGEMIGRDVSLLAPPETAGEIPQLLGRIRQGGHVTHFETRRIRKGGSPVDVSLSLSGVRDGGGTVRGASKIARDITDRKRAEERFRALLESAPDGMVIVNREGTIVLVNDQTERLFGYTRDELVGRSVDLLVPVRYREGHGGQRAGYVAQPHRRTKLAGLELFGRRKDGSEFPVEINLNPIETGGELLISSAIRDITDRKRAEEELERNRSFLDSVVENIPSMIFVKDAHELKFVRFNRAGEALLGRRREDLIGRNDYDLFPPEQADYFIARDREVLASRDRLAISEERVETKDHGTRFLQTTKVAILDRNGVPEYLLGISKDITERKRADEEIAALHGRAERHARDLEVSNRELEAFSYSVSHDLRAPLRHIDGFADLLRRHAGPGMDDKGRRYLTMIADSARSMGALIDDLLAFSRMGRTELTRTPVDLGALVQGVRASLAPETAGRDIEWTIGPLPGVLADPAMLKLVLVNLIANAIKFTRGRAPARIEIGSSEAGGETVVFVRDNGVGFDMTYGHKLFGVFQRLHGAEEFEGTGIGLANVRRIVLRHGGRVWAEGEIGRGSIFSFSLPRPEEPDTEMEQAA